MAQHLMIPMMRIVAWQEVLRNRTGSEWLEPALSAANQAIPIVSTTPQLRDGHPDSITLQIPADGRCGLAIDDVVIAVSSNALKTDRPVRLFIAGQSVGAPIQVDCPEITCRLDHNGLCTSHKCSDMSC